MSDCGRSADRTRQTTTAARWDRGQQQVRDLPSAVSTSTVITGSHVCSSRLINLWRIIIIRPPDNSREGLKFYPRTYFFIFFSIHRAQQPRCYQMYFGGSVLGRPKASTKNRDLAHPPNFYRGGGQKVRNLASFSTSLKFKPLEMKMQQNIRTLKQISCVKMIALCPRQVWWSWVHAPLRTVGQKCPIPKFFKTC